MADREVEAAMQDAKAHPDHNVMYPAAFLEGAAEGFVIGLVDYARTHGKCGSILRIHTADGRRIRVMVTEEAQLGVE